ncbi:hypothetical protein C5C90_14355 [Rathayibacter sp. AY1D4]|nr:hypothetical protein C5C90_14355 [Rathayibacter sp. AY1D4]PPH89735.1 hypothetical protein C5C64_09630 [Rathayibacter sp. AY1D3]
MPVHQPTRRQLLRSAAAGAISAAAAGLLAACTTPAPRPSPSTPDAAAPAPTPLSSTGTSVTPTPRSRILLAYFSRPGENYWNGGRRTLDVGNTEVLAGLIGDRIDCDVYRIEAADPYSDRYDPTVARNVQEHDTNARPAIAYSLPDLTGYDTVLLGSPIWNVQPPMILATFAEGVDLTGKTLLPFVTYAVSGLGSTNSFYRDLGTGAQLGDGLAVRGEDVAEGAPDVGTDVDQWLTASGLA